MTDATLILKYLKGIIEFNDIEFLAADLDMNEAVNMTDFTIYMKYLKGIDGYEI